MLVYAADTTARWGTGVWAARRAGRPSGWPLAATACSALILAVVIHVRV